MFISTILDSWYITPIVDGEVYICFNVWHTDLVQIGEKAHLNFGQIRKLDMEQAKSFRFGQNRDVPFPQFAPNVLF